MRTPTRLLPTLTDRWPTRSVPYPSGWDFFVDAGRNRETFWAGFGGWRRYLLDPEIPPTEHNIASEEVVRIQARIMGVSEITPAEGVAALHALLWIRDALREGRLPADEPIRLFEDNNAVSSKLSSGNPRGANEQLWRRMIRALRQVRQLGRIRIRPGRGYDNLADHLAVPTEGAVVWSPVGDEGFRGARDHDHGSDRTQGSDRAQGPPGC